MFSQVCETQRSGILNVSLQMEIIDNTLKVITFLYQLSHTNFFVLLIMIFVY